MGEEGARVPGLGCPIAHELASDWRGLDGLVTWGWQALLHGREVAEW